MLYTTATDTVAYRNFFQKCIRTTEATSIVYLCDVTMMRIIFFVRPQSPATISVRHTGGSVKNG